MAVNKFVVIGLVLAAGVGIYVQNTYAEPSDPYEALLWKAKKGDPQAQFEHGSFLIRSKTNNAMLNNHANMMKDPSNVSSMENIVNPYKNLDLSEAIIWLDKAAAQNHLQALNSLSAIYIHGQGTPKNTPKGLAYLEKAVSLNDHSAIITLGSMYYRGDVVTKDEVRGIQMMEKIAYLNDPSAHMALSLSYRMSPEKSQANLIKSYVWFKHGHSRSREIATQVLNQQNNPLLDFAYAGLQGNNFSTALDHYEKDLTKEDKIAAAKLYDEIRLKIAQNSPPPSPPTPKK